MMRPGITMPLMAALVGVVSGYIFFKPIIVERLEYDHNLKPGIRVEPFVKEEMKFDEQTQKEVEQNLESKKN